jgi:hypothetical protein
MPEDPDASRPFPRERQRIKRTMATNEFGFRMWVLGLAIEVEFFEFFE